jgi:hypothetical protein
VLSYEKREEKKTMNAAVMRDELKTKAFQFIAHHSSLPRFHHHSNSLETGSF